MTRVRTRRDLSRLLLPFSPLKTLHLPRSLTLILLGLVCVRSVLPYNEPAKPRSQDPVDPRPNNITEKEGRRSNLEDTGDWTQLDRNEEADTADESKGEKISADHPLQISEGSSIVVSRTGEYLENSAEYSQLIEIAVGTPRTHYETVARHERRKSRLGGSPEVHGSTWSDVDFGDYTAPRARRNFRNGKLGGKSKSTDLEESDPDCEDCEDEESEGKVTDTPRSSENNETGGGDGSAEVDVDLPPAAANASDEEPFTGFEGSQKFPIKVTYKPAVVPQVEKFDRRHFGPPKLEDAETTLAIFPTTLSPDLPKSPGKDVLHRHRKVDEITEEERRQETIDAIENANDTDDLWLPGASSGRRSSNIAAGKPAAEEKRATTMVPATSTGSDKASSAIPLTTESTEKINVTILGLFEMTRGLEPRPEGPSELQAARMAVEHVNEMNMLSRFRLRLVHNDTKVRLAIDSLLGECSLVRVVRGIADELVARAFYAFGLKIGNVTREIPWAAYFRVIER
ncbi:uncharacterized protein LOC144469971 [Augochlora pura]